MSIMNVKSSGVVGVVVVESSCSGESSSTTISGSLITCMVVVTVTVTVTKVVSFRVIGVDVDDVVDRRLTTLSRMLEKKLRMGFCARLWPTRTKLTSKKSKNDLFILFLSSTSKL